MSDSKVKVSRTIQQYKDMDSLQQYAEAQNLTILQMSKKLQNLEEKLKHAEELLKSNVPVISSQPEVNDFSRSDSEFICTVEIAKLKRVTSERELTLEESRKLDTYYKILNNINSKPPIEKDAEKLPTDNLLKIVESKNVDDGNK